MKVVDMHCDTIAALYENKEKGWTLQDNRLHIRLDKMKQGDYLLQNFALFVCIENCEDPYQQALSLAVCNLTDDMIRLLAEKGGVTGLNFCPSFLNAQKDYPGTAADVARHAAHIIKVGGEDCLGLGSDFDGIRTHAELPGADAMPVLEDALAKAGLTARQRDKVMGENVLRVYREVLG